MADGGEKDDHGILPGKGIPDRVLADLRSNENDRLNYYSGRRHRDLLYWQGFVLHMKQIISENEWLCKYFGRASL